MFVGLILVIIILFIYIIYLHQMINKITKKLNMINSLTTNLIITLPTKNRFFISLVNGINHLIVINKKSYQDLVEAQQQFDIAINNISHDIRTPLTVASGYTQLLNKNADKPQKVVIKKISSHLNEVEKKLDDLLTYNRLLEHRVEISLTEVDISSLMESTIVTYFEAFQSKDISVSLDIEKNVRLITDEDALKRLIENGIGNILNHGIHASKISLLTQKEEVILTISNLTNQIINDYDRLFDRFYTEDLARVNKNSGLGLYIIKELITLLNGSVYAYGQNDLFNLVMIFQKKATRL